jgi:hypothetical protein
MSKLSWEIFEICIPEWIFLSFRKGHCFTVAKCKKEKNKKEKGTIFIEYK